MRWQKPVLEPDNHLAGMKQLMHRLAERPPKLIIQCGAVHLLGRGLSSPTTQFLQIHVLSISPMKLGLAVLQILDDLLRQLAQRLTTDQKLSKLFEGFFSSIVCK